MGRMYALVLHKSYEHCTPLPAPSLDKWHNFAYFAQGAFDTHIEKCS